MYGQFKSVCVCSRPCLSDIHAQEKMYIVQLRYNLEKVLPLTAKQHL